jgi:hypothetical protein
LQVNHIACHGSINPLEVKDDGKFHEFEVVATYTKEAYVPVSIVVTVTGPHAHYHGTEPFFNDVISKVAGVTKTMVQVNGIRYLGSKDSSSK